MTGTEGDWRESYPNYLGCCHSLDANVGRLIDTLADKGILEDTVFIYTSDHGSHFRTRNSEYKRACHDGCIHIPMIIRGPGFMGGRVIDSLISLIDMPSTILDIAGVPIPEHYQGRQLHTMMHDTSAVWDNEIFLQISESQIGRCIRTAKWKYSVSAEGDGWNAPGSEVYYEEFLYDLENDPHERNNLVTDSAYAAIRAELADTLTWRMVAAGEDAPLILTTRL